ncbi:TAXI family TRAP transporter solute-binding subunit [Streptomyces sp. LX-29]|uniref:TAXI family TRAP transporter solute-binding subunit n=1 Tax=Streptomyces sp. LX-29 TaxID=2900152 RepID=UPI00240E8185|nr:TAXI family TRAP transporter solute-binding subunit [Streptomyces sp. LX-29]WFB10954.1 TAXI family TRAP transporter solute-binding subunit [Streptomyces sp. LX-29]
MSALPRRGLLALPLGTLLAGGALTGCTESGPHGAVRLATGPRGGPYAIFGSRLADEVRSSHAHLGVRVLTTAASVENLRLLGDGRADLALSLADSAADAAAGHGVFPRRLPVAALARLYLNYLHLVVPARSAIRTPAQLVGHTVSIGAAESGTSVTAERVLETAGVDTDRGVRLGLGASVTALRSGDVAAFFWSGGAPTQAIADLARRTPVRLVPLGDLAPALRRTYGPVYEGVAIPAGVYDQPGPTPTVATPSYLVCRTDLPDDVVRAVTGVLFARRDRLPVPDAPGSRLDERYAIGTGTVPLHPGAAGYYRSVHG